MEEKYNKELIKNKASECLNCKTKPCKSGCPLGNSIPDFIKLIKEENYELAFKKLTETTVLSPICGRICPHMSQCMGKCVKGIKTNPVKIGCLETFIGDMWLKSDWKLEPIDIVQINANDFIESTKNSGVTSTKADRISNKSADKKKIAVIGSGPSGLTCAAFLARFGFDVTIYEKNYNLGGILRYGIPEFRLDREILDNTINKILELGIHVQYGKKLGDNLHIAELCQQYNAIYIAIGANVSCKMGIPGEELNGVIGGNYLLEEINKAEKQEPNATTSNYISKFKGKKVAVIGGGNVAMDCARTVKKIGASEVKVIYRRAMEQMPAEVKEIEDAKSDGIEFLFQNNIIKIIEKSAKEGLNQENIEDSNIEKIECIKTELIQKMGEKRLSPVDVQGSNYNIDIDYVIMAIGSKVAYEDLDELKIKTDKYGYIMVDNEYRIIQECDNDRNIWRNEQMESLKNNKNNIKIYAGGDVTNTKSTVAWAAAVGRDVAYSIAKDLEI